MFLLMILGILSARTNFLTPADIDYLVGRFLDLSSIINVQLAPYLQAPGMEILLKATYARTNDSPEVIIQNETVEQIVRNECGPDVDTEFKFGGSVAYDRDTKTVYKETKPDETESSHITAKQVTISQT
jgi:hypothetical protein